MYIPRVGRLLRARLIRVLRTDRKLNGWRVWVVVEDDEEEEEEASAIIFSTRVGGISAEVVRCYVGI